MRRPRRGLLAWLPEWFWQLSQTVTSLTGDVVFSWTGEADFAEVDDALLFAPSGEVDFTDASGH